MLCSCKYISSDSWVIPVLIAGPGRCRKLYFTLLWCVAQLTWHASVWSWENESVLFVRVKNQGWGGWATCVISSLIVGRNGASLAAIHFCWNSETTFSLAQRLAVAHHVWELAFPPSDVLISMLSVWWRHRFVFEAKGQLCGGHGLSYRTSVHWIGSLVVIFFSLPLL